MTESSIVAVVYQDLADAFAELSSESTSPKAVRRSFANFVDLSQKLTSHMRKEYSEKKGKPWVASDFGGWNERYARKLWIADFLRRAVYLPNE